MKAIAGAITLLAAGWVLGAPLATAQAGMIEEPSAAVKSCIAANAANVDRVFDSLSEGAQFLINNACARPVAEQQATLLAERRRKATEEQDARQKEMCESRKSAPNAAESQFDPSAYLTMMCDNPAMIPDTYAMLETFDMGYGGISMNAPAAMTLASQTLLKLRIDRMDKKQ